MKDAYSKVVDIKNDHFKPSKQDSHKGYDNPEIYDAIVDRYFENKEKEAQKFRKADWSRQDKPYTVPNETYQQYYTSPVLNSHQFPNEIKIRPPTFEAEIPPKPYSKQQKIEDNEIIYVGMKKYTRATLPKNNNLVFR